MNIWSRKKSKSSRYKEKCINKNWIGNLVGVSHTQALDISSSHLSCSFECSQVHFDSDLISQHIVSNDPRATNKTTTIRTFTLSVQYLCLCFVFVFGFCVFVFIWRCVCYCCVIQYIRLHHNSGSLFCWNIFTAMHGTALLCALCYVYQSLVCCS